MCLIFQVLDVCTDVPRYTAIASFVNGTYIQGQCQAGVFVSCVETGFKVSFINNMCVLTSIECKTSSLKIAKIRVSSSCSYLDMLNQPCMQWHIL